MATAQAVAVLRAMLDIVEPDDDAAAFAAALIDESDRYQLLIGALGLAHEFLKVAAEATRTTPEDFLAGAALQWASHTDD